MICEKMKNMKQVISFSAIFIIISVFLGFFLFLNNTETSRKLPPVSSMHRKKVVTTVCVKKDSTLWDIATEYYTSEYEDVTELIEEIKVSNGIKQNTIYEGAYIIVPYYASCE